MASEQQQELDQREEMEVDAQEVDPATERKQLLERLVALMSEAARFGPIQFVLPLDMDVTQLRAKIVEVESLVTGLRLSEVKLGGDEEEQRGGKIRSLVRDCPPPAKFTGTKETFEYFRQDFIRYAVGSGLPEGRWTTVAASFMELKSPAWNRVTEFLESMGKDWSWLKYWGWEEFCEHMEAGQLGKAPDDIELRDQLLGSKQRMPPDTPCFVNHIKKIFAKLPTPIDEGTKVWIFLKTCCRTLHEEICVPLTGGSWKTFGELEAFTLSKAHFHDAKYKNYTWEGLPKEAIIGKGSSSSRSKYRTGAVSYSGVVGKDTGYLGGDSSRHNSAAAAAAGGGSSQGYGKLPRWGEDRGGSTNRPGPYSRLSAAAKYGNKESFNSRLSADDVKRNKEEGRCHLCGAVCKDANGNFDRSHIHSCPQRKRKRDVSDGH